MPPVNFSLSDYGKTILGRNHALSPPYFLHQRRATFIDFLSRHRRRSGRQKVLSQLRTV